VGPRPADHASKIWFASSGTDVTLMRGAAAQASVVMSGSRLSLVDTRLPSSAKSGNSSMRRFLGTALLAISCAVSAMPPVETWGTATATRTSDGWVMVYRFADRLSSTFKKSSQPERVSIVWRYAGSKGLPVTSERNAMDALESDVERLVPNRATLAVVSTGNNQRSWVYYTESASNFIEAVRSMNSHASHVSLEFETAADPGWAFHDSFVRSMRR